MASLYEYRIEAVDRGLTTNTALGKTGNTGVTRVGIQNPKDTLITDSSDGRNDRELFRIPLSMKYYPKGFVWVNRASATSEDLVKIVNEDGGILDTRHEYGNCRLEGGMFIDQSTTATN